MVKLTERRLADRKWVSMRPPLAGRVERMRPAPEPVKPGLDDYLLLVEADDARQLRSLVAGLASVVPGLSRRAIRVLARHTVAGRGAERAQPGRCWRAAFTKTDPRSLCEGLAQVMAWLDEGRRWASDRDNGTCLAHERRRPRIAFVFPGQAAPVSFDGGAWARRFPSVASVFADPALPPRGGLDNTAVVQPYLLATQLAGLQVLEGFGLRADIALGHSLGELTALHWAGACDARALLRLGADRGRLMGQWPRGAMCHISAPMSELYWIMDPSPKVVVSCINGPDSTVLSGPVAAVEAVAARARRRGWKATRLRVRGAFHSPLIRPAANAFTEALNDYRFRPLRGRVISTTTATWLPAGLDVRAHLIEHMTGPVRFIEAMDRVAAAADLCIEVGSGSLLRGLASSWLDLPVLATEVGSGDFGGLKYAMAVAYVLGAEVDKQALVGAGRGLVGRASGSNETVGRPGA